MDKWNSPLGHPSISAKEKKQVKKPVVQSPAKEASIPQSPVKEASVPQSPVKEASVPQSPNRTRVNKLRRAVQNQAKKIEVDSDSEEEKADDPDYVIDEENTENFTKETSANKNKKVKRDKQISNMMKTRTGKYIKGSKTSTDYDEEIPAGFDDTKANKQKRQGMIIERRYDKTDINDLKKFVPTREDEELFEKYVIKQVYITSARFQVAGDDLSAESRKRMMEGKAPLREEKQAETKTAPAYKNAFKPLIIMLQQMKGRKLSVSDFFDFGKETLFKPQSIRDELLAFKKSSSIKQHMLEVYSKLVRAQAAEAEKNPHKFENYVINAENLTKVQLDHAADIESNNFMKKCGNVLDKNKLLSKELSKIREAEV